MSKIESTEKDPIILVDGSSYKIELEGVDRAGNKSNISINKNKNLNII